MQGELNYIVATYEDGDRKYFHCYTTEPDRTKIAAELCRGICGAVMVDFINPKEWKDTSVLNQYLENTFGVNLRLLELFCMDLITLPELVN